MKWMLYIILFFILCISAKAQQGLTPFQISVLNQLYANAGADTIPGTWLIDQTVTSNKLSTSLIAFIASKDVFSSSVAAGIVSGDISAWNTAASDAATALGWGDHSLAGYLTGELDPGLSAWQASVPIRFTGAITNPCIGVTNYTYYNDGFVVSNSTVTP